MQNFYFGFLDKRITPEAIGGKDYLICSCHSKACSWRFLLFEIDQPTVWTLVPRDGSFNSFAIGFKYQEIIANHNKTLDGLTAVRTYLQIPSYVSSDSCQTCPVKHHIRPIRLLGALIVILPLRVSGIPAGNSSNKTPTRSETFPGFCSAV